MNKPILLLRLEGPLQSWGSRSRWDIRETQSEPTKSGIIGLLGCALGYPRADERLVDLEHSLLFGVRVEAPGRIREDFQTISGFLPTADGRYRHSGVSVGASLEKIASNSGTTPATIISPRYYLEDASFLVGLTTREGISDAVLESCREALLAPHWPIYLGRRSCPPTRPVFYGLTSAYASLEDALTKCTWSHFGVGAKDRKVNPAQEQTFLDVQIEDASGSESRQDVVQLNDARLYGFRNVRRTSIPFSAVRPKQEDKDAISIAS